MKQYEAVIEALEHLGGAATLGQLNQEVMKITDCIWSTSGLFRRHHEQLSRQGFTLENVICREII